MRRQHSLMMMMVVGPSYCRHPQRYIQGPGQEDRHTTDQPGVQFDTGENIMLKNSYSSRLNKT